MKSLYMSLWISLSVMVVVASGLSQGTEDHPPTVVPAASASSQVSRDVISTSGGLISNSTCRLIGTVGQTAVGIRAGGTRRVHQGFWPDFELGAGGCCVGSVGNVDCDPGDVVDIGDLTKLIDNLFISFAPLCCIGEANCDGSGEVDIGDLTRLIDNLFITFTPLGGCQ